MKSATTITNAGGVASGPKKHWYTLAAVLLCAGALVVASPLFLLAPAILSAALPLGCLGAIFFLVRASHHYFHPHTHHLKAEDRVVGSPGEPSTADSAASHGGSVQSGHKSFLQRYIKNFTHADFVATMITFVIAPLVLVSLTPIVTFVLPISAVIGSLLAAASQFVVIPLAVVASIAAGGITITMCGSRIFSKH